MKKIININLSGRVIPIEDAAYESLQLYIESLRRYFANEEGRDEIINDIESRIAELMSEKVKRGATAITEADVTEIINEMGRIEDFEEVEAAENPAATQASSEKGGSQPFADLKLPRGRLYRDSSDKMIGGVCSGLANYLNIDPAIIRILFLLLTFGAGMSVLVYLVLWIVVPKRKLEAVKTKRLFRNPEDRILGGVAGGIAAYLNTEAWLVRLIFAAPLLLNILFGVLHSGFFLFGGDPFPSFFLGSFTFTFFIIYVILWIILPEAKSTYEKMEMRGQDVDVARIRQNVKGEMESLKSKAQAWGEEVKDSAQNLGAQARNFVSGRGEKGAESAADTASRGRSFGSVIGLIFKIFFISIAGFIALALFFAVIAALSSGVIEPLNNFILIGFWQKAALWGTLIFFLVVPVIAIIVWMLRRLMNVRSQNRYLGWTFGGLWALGWISLLVFGVSMAKSWRSETVVDESLPLQGSLANRLVVRIDEPKIRYSGSYGWFDNDRRNNGGWDITEDTLKLSEVKIRAAKSTDSLYRVTVWKESHGWNLRDAERRAGQIQYSVASRDSVLLLGSGFAIGKDQKYRGQKVVVEIQIPEGKMIRFDESVSKLNYVNVRLARKRNWRQDDWEFSWHDDQYHNWEPGKDYIMTAGGRLIDASKPDRGEGEVYEYKRDEDRPRDIRQQREADRAEREKERLQLRVEREQKRLDEEIERRRRRIEEEQQNLERLQKAKAGERTTKVELKKSAPPKEIAAPIFSLLI